MDMIAPAAEITATHTWIEAWHDASRSLLDVVGVEQGWICADIGCGEQGILELLHQRAGSDGCVVGVDRSTEMLARARRFCKERRLEKVQLIQEELAHVTLPRDIFDFVHARFALPSLMRPERAVRAMLDLVRPGGVIALQEVDHRSWTLAPQPPAWPRLRVLLEATHGLHGEADTGCRLGQLLSEAGVEAVTVRPVAQWLHHSHPFVRASLRSMAELRQRAIHAGLASAAELDALLAELDHALDDPDLTMRPFTVVQAWGYKPAATPALP